MRTRPARAYHDAVPADLSRIHVLVPLRTLEGGKARLGGALDAEEREDLIIGMLRRLLTALREWGGAEAVHVVSPDPAVLAVSAAAGASTVVEAPGSGRGPREGLGGGLNQALLAGRAAALARGCTALLVLPADLPVISAATIGRLVDAADAALAASHGGPIVAIAPADARRGTNALLLSPPGVIDPAFGEDSFEAHLRSAEAAGASVQVVVDVALGFDLDTPEDLERLGPAEITSLQELGRSGVAGAAVVADESPAARGGEAAQPDRETRGAPPPRPPVMAMALPPLPDVRPGDDLAGLIADAVRAGAAADPDLAPRPGDVLVVTQKVVSKAEGRLVDLHVVVPRPEAVEFARRWNRDARQVEVVLREAVRVLRMDRGVIIAQTRQGYVCANSGVDASNIEDPDSVTLLPEDPDLSAAGLRSRLRDLLGVDLAVVISDSFGRPWRWGITDVALGVAGFAPLDDLRGRPDTSGRLMQATVVAVADEIASAAELASGKTSKRPVVLVRGVELPVGDGSITRDVVIPAEADLFR